MRASGWPLLAALWAAGAPVASGADLAERVVLRWQPIQGAVGYDLQVATDVAFTQRELDARVELAGYRLGPSEARRYWRVRAVDADGRPGQWSAAKTIAPVLNEPPPVASRRKPPPEPVLLAAPPLKPAAVGEAAVQSPQEPQPGAGPILPAAGIEQPFAPGPDLGVEGVRAMDVFSEGRPGLMVGWRDNLLGVVAPSVTVEGTWPLPWFGAAWSAALRAGWWRERATVPISAGITAPLDATADVFPIRALVTRTFAARWGRLYAGAGLGVNLVMVRLPDQGALEATGALDLVAGAGRRLGPGEAFMELAGGLGVVDGPLGRLRTGGLALSLGYRLGR